MGGLVSGVGQVVLAGLNAQTEQQQIADETAAAKRNESLKEIEVRQQGEFYAGKIRAEGTQTAARQRVAYANSGVDPTVGTAAAVQSSTEATAEKDARQIQNNAARAAWGFEQNRETLQKDFEAKKRQSQLKTQGSVLTGGVNMMNGVMSLGMGGGGGG